MKSQVECVIGERKLPKSCDFRFSSVSAETVALHKAHSEALESPEQNLVVLTLPRCNSTLAELWAQWRRTASVCVEALMRFQRRTCLRLEIYLRMPLYQIRIKVFPNLFYQEGNSSPLQYSCLENRMDRGAWWAAVQGAAKTRTRLPLGCTHKPIRPNSLERPLSLLQIPSLPSALLCPVPTQHSFPGFQSICFQAWVWPTGVKGRRLEVGGREKLGAFSFPVLCELWHISRSTQAPLRPQLL